MTLLVGQMFGPAVLAIFNTYRTLSRVTMQITAMFANSLWAELARLYGEGGADALRHLYARSARLCNLLAIAASVALLFASPHLLRIWTHGVIEMRWEFMALMLAYAAGAGLWNLPRVLLMSTNQHVGLAGWAVGMACFALVLAAAAGVQWGLTGVGAALLLSEIMIAIVCIVLARRVLTPSGAMALAV
jgi:O-antigen/teichoic acid export membrane protein